MTARLTLTELAAQLRDVAEALENLVAPPMSASARAQTPKPHWTQTPEGKHKLAQRSRATRKRMAKKGSPNA